MKNRSIVAIAVTLICASSTRATWAAPKPKYGPSGHPYAEPLAFSHSYFQSSKHPAPDFWALIGYYVPQYSGAACSAASVTMALNAARARLPKTSDDKLVLQPELVEKTEVDGWKERLGTLGYGPTKAHGATLDVLRDVTEAAFRANGFPKATVKAVHVRDLSASTRAAVRRALAQNEKSGNDFILANFNQRAFTDDADVGHIAPVGAYDASKRRVLVLDPDREWYEPYWVSEERFVQGMHTKDGESGNYRGFLVIELNI